MSAAEVAAVTVPLSKAEERLRQTLHAHGVAIVTGVADAAALKRLEAEFASDLADLVDEDALSGEPLRVREAHARFVAEGPRAFPPATVRRFTRTWRSGRARR